MFLFPFCVLAIYAACDVRTVAGPRTHLRAPNKNVKLMRRLSYPVRNVNESVSCTSVLLKITIRLARCGTRT